MDSCHLTGQYVVNYSTLCAVYVLYLNAYSLHFPEKTTLQIEIGRQRNPKECWREETHRSFYTHRDFYTEKSLHKGALCIQKIFHREVFTLRTFPRQMSRSFRHRIFYTKKSLRRGFFYPQTRLHTEIFIQRSLYTEERLHTKALTYSKLLHTQELLHREAFTQRNFLHTEDFT